MVRVFGIDHPGFHQVAPLARSPRSRPRDIPAESGSPLARGRVGAPPRARDDGVRRCAVPDRHSAPRSDQAGARGPRRSFARDVCGTSGMCSVRIAADDGSRCDTIGRHCAPVPATGSADARLCGARRDTAGDGRTRPRGDSAHDRGARAGSPPTTPAWCLPRCRVERDEERVAVAERVASGSRSTDAASPRAESAARSRSTCCAGRSIAGDRRAGPTSRRDCRPRKVGTFAPFVSRSMTGVNPLFQRAPSTPRRTPSPDCSTSLTGNAEDDSARIVAACRPSRACARGSARPCRSACRRPSACRRRREREPRHARGRRL